MGRWQEGMKQDKKSAIQATGRNRRGRDLFGEELSRKDRDQQVTEGVYGQKDTGRSEGKEGRGKGKN